MVMGRPKKANPNTTSISFKASPEFVNKLKAYSVLVGKSQGAVIREAVEHYIKPKKSKEE